jgi:hypothetical protein
MERKRKGVIPFEYDARRRRRTAVFIHAETLPAGTSGLNARARSPFGAEWSAR